MTPRLESLGYVIVNASEQPSYPWECHLSLGGVSGFSPRA
jgi:hypothetical protein